MLRISRGGAQRMRPENFSEKIRKTEIKSNANKPTDKPSKHWANKMKKKKRSMHTHLHIVGIFFSLSIDVVNFWLVLCASCSIILIANEMDWFTRKSTVPIFISMAIKFKKYTSIMSEDTHAHTHTHTYAQKKMKPFANVDICKWWKPNQIGVKTNQTTESETMSQQPKSHVVLTSRNSFKIHRFVGYCSNSWGLLRFLLNVNMYAVPLCIYRCG